MSKQYNDICDFFMLGKSDEMRTKSDKFFIFFTDFFTEIQKNMPKPDVKKKKPAAGAVMGMAVKKAGMASMMAELAAKQASQKK